MTDLHVARIIVTTLIEIPDGGPSSHFYLAFQNAGVNFEQYEHVLRMLINARLIKSSAHWLTYIGPSLEPDATMDELQTEKS